MASLVSKVGLLARPLLARRGTFAAPAVRSYASAWNKDWKPGPYPKTPEEREAAAKKYGLRPEDYEPYPDDGMGYGDYPMLSRVSSESRDPYEAYDWPEYKRNFGEPLHVDADAMMEDKWNPNIQYPYNLHLMALLMVAIVGGFTLALYLTLPYPHFHPVMDKQLPNKGQTHYTFEPVD